MDITFVFLVVHCEVCEYFSNFSSLVFYIHDFGHKEVFPLALSHMLFHSLSFLCYLVVITPWFVLFLFSLDFKKY